MIFLTTDGAAINNDHVCSFFTSLFEKKNFLFFLQGALKTTPYGHLTFKVHVSLENPDGIQEYNKTYRQKNKATNILSFSALPEEKLYILKKSQTWRDIPSHEILMEDESIVLGDLLVCPEIVLQEVEELANSLFFQEDIEEINNPQSKRYGFFEALRCSMGFMTPEENLGPQGSHFLSLAQLLLVYKIYHLLLHGVLHLLHYDHETPEDAQEMETIEIHGLGLLHYPNPYDEWVIYQWALALGDKIL